MDERRCARVSRRWQGQRSIDAPIDELATWQTLFNPWGILELTFYLLARSQFRRGLRGVDTYPMA